MAYGYQHPGYAPPYQQPPDPARQGHSYPHGQYEQPPYGPSPVPGAMPAAAPPQQYGYRPPPGPHAQHGPRECFNCGAPNHWAQNCPEPRRAVPAGSAWRSHDSHPNKRPRSHGPVVTQYPVPPDYAAHPHAYGQPQRAQPPRPAPFSPETHQYGPPPSTSVQYMPPQYGPSFVDYGPPQPRAMSPQGARPWPAPGYNYPTAHVPPHPSPNQYPPHGPHGYPVPPQYPGHYGPPVPAQAYGNPNAPRPQQPHPHHLQGPSPHRGPPYAAPYASPQAGRTPRPRFRHHRLSVPEQQQHHQHQQPKEQLQLQDQSQPQVQPAGPQPQEAVSPEEASNSTDEVDEDEYLKLDFVSDLEPRIPANRVARPLLANPTAPGSFEALLIVAADYSDSASEFVRCDNFDEVTASIRLTRYWAEMADDPVFRQIHTGDDASSRGKQLNPHEAALSTDMHGSRDSRIEEAVSHLSDKHNRQGLAPKPAAVGQSELAGSSSDGRTTREHVHPGEKQHRQRSASPASHGRQVLASRNDEYKLNNHESRHRTNDQSQPEPGSANNYRERSPIGSRKRDSAEAHQMNRSTRDKPGRENHGLDGSNDASNERLRQADNAWVRLKKRQPQVADAYSRRW